MERVHNAQVEHMLQLEQQQNVKIVRQELIQELEQHHVQNARQEHQLQQNHHHAQNVLMEHLRKKVQEVVHNVHRLVKVIASRQQDFVKDVLQDMDILVDNVLYVQQGNIQKEEQVFVHHVQQGLIQIQLELQVVNNVRLENILLQELRVVLIVKMENIPQRWDQLVVNPAQEDVMEIVTRKQENVVHALLDMDIRVDHVQNVQ